MRRVVARERTIAAPAGKKPVRYCRCGCGRVVDADGARGLYSSCYRQTAKYVNDGLFTWEQLERDGKVDRKPVTLKEWLLRK